MMHTRFVVGGDSCQVYDFEYCISGRMDGVMDDGDELVFGPGMRCEFRPGTTPGSSGINHTWGLVFKGGGRIREAEQLSGACGPTRWRRAAPRRPLCGAAHPRAGEPGDAP
jgi:hypothetical protein